MERRASPATGAPKKPLFQIMEGVGAVYNDPQTTNRIAKRPKQVMGDSNVALGRPIMASDGGTSPSIPSQL
jgi:hypothetical protein